jgi:deoxycytidine triphosphate deaminase
MTTDFSPGFLADSEIKQLLTQGKVFRNGTWSNECIRHASYTLRVGSTAKVRRPTQHVTLHQMPPLVEIPITEKSPLSIAPGDTAMVYCHEQFEMPRNMIGLTVARGLFFTSALCPENTYVDPGFAGHLYITITNVSHQTHTLPFNTPIARLFLCVLGTDVEEPYTAGNNKGIAQVLDAPRTDKTPVRIAQAADDLLLNEVAAQSYCGSVAAELIRRQRNELRYVKYIYLPLAIATALLIPPLIGVLHAIANWFPDLSDKPVYAGVVGSVLAYPICTVGNKLLKLLVSELTSWGKR